MRQNLKKLPSILKGFFLSKWFKRGAIIFLILAIVGIIILTILLKPYHSRAQEYDLSKIDDVELPSIIFDKNGKELGRMYVENRSVISIDQMPQLLIDCLVAQEDQRFFKHKGVDWLGLVRMVYLNAKAGEVTQGASTVTMQLARNAFNLKSEALKRDENGIQRKLVEIFLAHRIGKKYSSEAGKKYILENYLNRVPFGHGYYGARSASLGYFGKEPEKLNWEEAASMVTCIKNPSAFSPLRYPSNNKGGRNHVFRRLKAEGVIDKKEYKRLLELPVKTNPKPLKRGTSHLYEKIGFLSRQIVGEEAMSEGGYRIYTTIDNNLQAVADSVLSQKLIEIEETEGYSHSKYEDYDSKKGSPEYLQGGLLINDPKTGKVLAHVGGRNYAHTQFDFIDVAKRPLGTGVFPFLYALAIDEGRSPSENILDESIDNRLVMVGGREGILGEWGSETLTPKYEGEITLRHALEQSKISSTVRLGKSIGVEKFAEFAENLGMDFPEKDKLLARDLLGWVPTSVKEAAKAYSAIANDGKVPNKLYYINKIESSSGLLVHLTSKSEMRDNTKPVMTKATAFQVDNILRGIPKEGNISDVSEDILSSGFKGGGKTGTPYNFEDAWAFAYNNNLVCSTWVGFQQGNKGEILPNGFAKNIAWPIVSEFFNNIQKDLRGSVPEMPEGVVKKEICRVSGLLATRYCFSEKHDDNGKAIENSYKSTVCHEYYKEGEEPVEICYIHMGLDGETSFVDQYAPTQGVTAARPVIQVDPVKPSSPVVVGRDPYGAVENSATEEGVPQLGGAYASGLLILNDEVAGEDEAFITMPKPNKLKLMVNPEDLKPRVTKAIVIED